MVPCGVLEVITLNDVAASYHEMYLACVNAGFTETQAIYLVGQVWVAKATAPHG